MTRPLFSQAELLDIVRRASTIDDDELLQPGWAEAFAWAVEAMRTPSAAPNLEGVANAPESFDEIWRPVVLAARRRLIDRTGGRWPALFQEPARAALERGLVQRLAGACGPGLFGDFAVFRELRRMVQGGWALPFWSAKSRDIYEAYLAAWRADRCREFFLIKPVAARLVGTVAADWLSATAELVGRLDRDRVALDEAFADGEALGAVVSLRTNLSDPHRNGRTVAVLGFGGGRTVVYKPKDLRIDEAWNGLVAWLDRRQAPVSLRAAKVLSRDGYGWSECIEADSEPGDEALYHRRAGGLLALLHALRGIDFHHENLIRGGDGLIPIDLETLLHPTLAAAIADTGDDPGAEAAWAMAQGSVLAMHYLPAWMKLPGNRILAVGGLDAPRGQAGDRAMFRNLNTDAMAFDAGAAPAASRAEPARHAVALADHLEDLSGEFIALYDFLVRERQALLAADGPIIPFRLTTVRVLVAQTVVYAAIKRRAYSHQNLGNGADWSLQFDFRARMVRPDAPAERWRLLAAERRALARMDVPLFTARADQDWLESCDGERIDGCLAGSPYDQAVARIKALGEADRALQERLIRATVGVAARRPGAAPGGVDWSRASGLVDTAAQLGDALCATALNGGGQAAWIGLTPLDHEHGEVSVLGGDLYAGTAGVAVFLAALGRVRGDARHRDLALRAIAFAREIPNLADGGARQGRLMGIGGAEGLGSLVYAMTRVSQFLGEAALLADARRLAMLIDDHIEADRSHDVMSGAAGAILGLLALHRARADDAVLAVAGRCGRSLLKAQIADPKGDKGWRTLPREGPMLCGFSHGAAGIALALARLYAATGETAFRDAAADGLRYERRHFMPAVGNWPDYQFSDRPDGAAAPCQWCHGAAGIGLARVGGLGLIDNDDEVIGEIEAAIATTRAAPPLARDHLCCGNAGRIDFLLTSGLRLDRPDLINLAREQASERLSRAAERGGFAWLGGDEGLNPGLFLGASGIGYELLRLAEPEIVPSVLLWD